MPSWASVTSILCTGSVLEFSNQRCGLLVVSFVCVVISTADISHWRYISTFLNARSGRHRHSRFVVMPSFRRVVLILVKTTVRLHFAFFLSALNIRRFSCRHFRGPRSTV